MAESSTYVVIGAGLAGAATAWRLAADGHQVTVLERSSPANADGSSHGSARILRYSYPDPLYARLVLEARTLWDDLERESGIDLITPTGALDSGSIRDPRQLASVLEELDVEHELLGPREAAQRFPMVAFGSEVLWHPAAGVIDSETTVHAMLDLARQHGAQVLTDWELTRAERTAHGFAVSSTTGATVRAEHLIVCAGGWLPVLLDLLPLPHGLRPALPRITVRQEQAVHFPYRDPSPESAARWPSFIHKDEQILAFGLPGGRDAGFRGQKVAEYHGGRIIPSGHANDHRIDPAGRERLKTFAARCLPGVESEPYAEATCLFTSTPTEDFLLDTHDGITLVSPCSGHGGKFAPLIGELAAGLATGRGTVPDVFRAPHVLERAH
jgi:sarcosine oxidase